MKGSAFFSSFILHLFGLACIVFAFSLQGNSDMQAESLSLRFVILNSKTEAKNVNDLEENQEIKEVQKEESEPKPESEPTQEFSQQEKIIEDKVIEISKKEKTIKPAKKEKIKEQSKQEFSQTGQNSGSIYGLSTQGDKKNFTESGVGSQEGMEQKARIAVFKKPEYPPRARQAGEEGRVEIKVNIDDKGKIIIAEISQSSGFERLDNAAFKAALKAKFEPREGIIIIPVVFELEASL